MGYIIVPVIVFAITLAIAFIGANAGMKCIENKEG